MPKRGHPGQYGVEVPQSSYLDPQMISRMANEIFHELPLPAGTPEMDEARVSVVGALRQQSPDVDAVRRRQVEPFLQLGISESFLDQPLAIVERSLHRQRRHVVAPTGQLLLLSG